MKRIVFAFILVAGCDPKHSHGPEEAGPEEEEKSAQVTVWDERFEIFLEHKRVVVDTPTSFVTHVTDLKTLEPRQEGKVVFVLRQGDVAPSEHVEDAPKRAGIYVPELKFPKPGEWSVGLRIPIDGAERVVELPKLTVFSTKEEAARAPDPEVPEGISFLKEQQWKLRTKVEPVGTRRMAERLRLPAVVSARPGSRASVLPPLSGRVLAPDGKPFPALGERVEAGQVLALLQPPFSYMAVKVVEAEADVARTKLSLAQAELSHARVEKLAASEARTARELEESGFAVRAAQGAHEAALALRSAYEKSGLSTRAGLPVFELRTSIAGTVIQIGAAIGEQVPQDRAVFTVLATEHVLIEARIAEADVARVGRSREAVYETPDAKGRFVPLLGTGGAKLVFLGLEVDVATRTIPLVYDVPNPDGTLRVGMALTVHVETGRADQALSIPESALVDEGGRPVAFVQLSGETFEKRDLTLGLRDSGFAQVLGGLRAGERLVTKGAYAVRLASVSTSLPAHGHSH